MLKPIRSILFATDLTKNCQQALEFTTAVATRYHATIYMLHVIEKLPDNMNERLKDLLGRHEWDKLVTSQKETVQKSLLGKTPTNSVVREAIYNFCKEEGIDDTSCNIKSRQIIISDGEVIEDILKNAEENDCDLIVLGGHRHFFSKSAVGGTVKGVLKKSKIPVTMVPPVEA